MVDSYINKGWVVVFVTALALMVPPASAQMSFAGQSDAGAATLVDEQVVIDNLRSSFTVTTGELFASHEFQQGGSDQARQLITNTTSTFLREARLAVNELKGDGVLAADEVTSEIERLRKQHLDELERALTALAEGHAAPPVRSEFSSAWHHSIAVAKYTFTERNSLQDWLMLLAALLGGIALAWVSARVLSAAAKRLRKNGHRWLAEVVAGTSGPLYLVAIVVASKFAFDWLWVPGVADEWFGRAVNIFLIGALFWFTWHALGVLARGVAWLLQKTYNHAIDKHIVVLITRTLRIAALAVFVLALVNGVMDSNLTGIIAGLGVLGVILSFLMRGTIENIFASFTIFGDKPFRVGDLVVFGEELGSIEDIGFRSTRLRTLDGHLITIPNSQLIDYAIHNVGARPSIRRRFRIGLPFESSAEQIEQAISILRDVLKDHKGQPKDQPPHVVFEGFGEHELKIMVQYHFEPADYWKALEFDTEVNLEIFRRFDEAGLEFAFPTRTVHLHDADQILADNAADEISHADDEHQAA